VVRNEPGSLTIVPHCKYSSQVGLNCKRSGHINALHRLTDFDNCQPLLHEQKSTTALGPSLREAIKLDNISIDEPEKESGKSFPLYHD
jgi:hypothetical protein